MKMEHKAFPLEIKEVGDSGEFSGYLSVFGNIDSYREVVMPGAFRESLADWVNNKKRLPPALWQHDATQPLGPFTKMEEDEHGLYVEGKLLINEIERAREAHALLKNNVISGMSIGFNTVSDEVDKKAKVRKLTKLNLWEGSIVTFPANTESNVTSVKNFTPWRDGLPTEKEFERYLRESGFSKTEATAITCKGFGHLLRSYSGATEGEELSVIFNAVKNCPSNWKT